MNSQTMNTLSTGRFTNLNKEYISHCFKTQSTVSVFFKYANSYRVNGERLYYDFRITLNVYHQGVQYFQSEMYVNPKKKVVLGMHATFKEIPPEGGIRKKLKDKIFGLIKRKKQCIPNKELHIHILKTLLYIQNIPVFSSMGYSHGFFTSYYLRALYTLYQKDKMYYDFAQDMNNEHKLLINTISLLKEYETFVSKKEGITNVFIKGTKR